MKEEPCLSILVLTEDSAKDSVDTIATLAKKMLLLADKAARTNRIELEPQREGAREAMRGNLWKSAKPFDRPKLIALGRAIAAKLLEARVPGFVLFHVDGDRVWADRASSENVEKFGEFVRRYVEQSVHQALCEQQKTRPLAVDVERDKAAAMKRLLRLTPFYSIEAWLYQNTAEAIRLCSARCGRHSAKIKAWEADRGALDEVHKPKDELCLGSEHNQALAGPGFPSEDVYYAGKSYEAAVSKLFECEELLTALSRTYA